MRWHEGSDGFDLYSTEEEILGWINRNICAVVGGAPANPGNYDRREFDTIPEAKAWLEYACTFWEMTKEMPPEGEWEWNGVQS
jgi:hypothetical protein